MFYSAKLDKYPNGYPGDAQPPEFEVVIDGKRRTFRKARMKVRWRCQVCDNLFSQGSKICESCKHERCQDCKREPYVVPSVALNREALLTCYTQTQEGQARAGRRGSQERRSEACLDGH